MRDHDHNCSAALAVTTGTLFRCWMRKDIDIRVAVGSPFSTTFIRKSRGEIEY